MHIFVADVDNMQSKDFKIYRERGSGNYLFVLFKSTSKVLTEGEYRAADCGDYILFDKNSIQSYYPVNNNLFLHDYMHFDTENDAEEALVSTIPKDVLLFSSFQDSVSDILFQIKKEINSPFTKYKKEALSHLGNTFLYRLKNEMESSSATDINKSHLTVLHNLRLDIYNNPQKAWCIENAALSSRLSRSHFQRLYKGIFSVSFNEDVINARISKAKVLISGGTLNINEVANKCGYENTEHFIRQFKNKTGFTPNKFKYRDTV